MIIGTMWALKATEASSAYLHTSNKLVSKVSLVSGVARTQRLGQSWGALGI